MKSGSLKRSLSSAVIILGFTAFTFISCGGIHNEPPAEVIRTSGAGPSTGGSGTTSLVGGENTTATTAEGENQESNQAEEELSTAILDSTGNPIGSKK